MWHSAPFRLTLAAALRVECHITDLITQDLKLGTFSAADKGQMDLYLAWLKEHEWRDAENEPVGLILCRSKITPRKLLEKETALSRVFGPYPVA